MGQLEVQAVRMREEDVQKAVKAALEDKYFADEEFTHLSDWQRQNLRKLVRKELRARGLKLSFFWKGYWFVYEE